MLDESEEEVLTPRQSEYQIILASEDNQELLDWLRSNILHPPTKDLGQQISGLTGAIFGTFSFAFSGVLGYEFGMQVVKFFNITNAAGEFVIAGTFSASAFIPLAMLSAPHSKETFELIYNQLKCTSPSILEKRNPRFLSKIFGYGRNITVFTIGSLAAADSTYLTHQLYKGLIGNFIYPLDAITQLSMTILRGWSLKNFAGIAYQWAKTSVFNKRTAQEISVIENMQSSLTNRLDVAIDILNRSSDDFCEALFKKIILDRRTGDASEEDLWNMVNEVVNFDERSVPAEIKITPKRNESILKKSFCLAGSAIGALSINGFIPPSRDMGHFFYETLSNATSISNVAVEAVVVNSFPVSISMCFGALTVFATYYAFDSLYNWFTDKINHCHSSHDNDRRDDNRKDIKRYLVAAVTILALIISAGSAIPATELSLDYSKDNTKIPFAIMAFIGLFATDYYPLQEFIHFAFESATPRQQIIDTARRLQQVIPKLSAQYLLTFFKKSECSVKMQRHDALIVALEPGNTQDDAERSEAEIETNNQILGM